MDAESPMPVSMAAAETVTDQDWYRHAALMAHELHNPLMPIINAAAVIRRVPRDAELVTRSAAIIERQARIVARLIDDLMNLSTAKLGTLRLQRAGVTLTEVVQQSLEAVSPLVAEAGHRLKVSLANEPLVLHADAMRLGQALQNLIRNAAKYNEQRGEIRVWTTRDHDEATVSVSDDGIGLTAADLETIFEPFAQVDKHQHGGVRCGLGVGLYLARQLVEAHGGSLVARSAGLGRGATFTLRIPCEIASASMDCGQISPNKRSDSFFTTP
jgi:signal transduction histidine kinase